jgi:hypothetical protein
VVCNSEVGALRDQLFETIHCLEERGHLDQCGMILKIMEETASLQFEFLCNNLDGMKLVSKLRRHLRGFAIKASGNAWNNPADF